MEALDAVMEVNRIFKANKWVEKDVQELAFNGFCKLFVLLAPDERKLILELTENYHWITQSEYQDKFIQAMESVNAVDIETVTKVYFFPIIKPEDENKVKSGQHLLYMIKAYKQLMRKYSHVKFEFISEFEEIQKLNLLDHERLFLVDDYIGSGQTFNYCMTELGKNATLSAALTKVVCIAIQEETLINLVTDGFGVLKTLIVKRGITDFNVEPIIDEKKKLMREIERHVPGAKSFSLGYNETEALITMMRTPDNTFPVFWKRFRKDGKLFDAPFSRLEEL
jgi:hypothetical protein